MRDETRHIGGQKSVRRLGDEHEGKRPSGEATPKFVTKSPLGEARGAPYNNGILFRDRVCIRKGLNYLNRYVYISWFNCLYTSAYLMVYYLIYEIDIREEQYVSLSSMTQY